MSAAFFSRLVSCALTPVATFGERSRRRKKRASHRLARSHYCDDTFPSVPVPIRWTRVGGSEMFWSSCPPPQTPSHEQPLRVWRLSRAARGWRKPEREAHIVARRDPSSSGLQAPLSRTRRTGPENFQASHWSVQAESGRRKRGKVCERVLPGETLGFS